MSKRIVGKVVRKEGREDRKFTQIECSECGKQWHVRKKKEIEKCLSTPCSHRPRGSGGDEFLRKLQADKRMDGRTKHYLWGTYEGMMARCYNPTHKSYNNYGGRDIQVCIRWIVDFWAYVEDMGDRPKGHTMDRIDNDGPYHPLNVQWSTPEEQIANQRKRFTMLTDEEYMEMLKAKKRIYNNTEARKAYRKAYGQKHYQKRQKGWWREVFNLYNNPYVYGPMPWKRISRAHRQAEAVERGWHVPLNHRKKK